MGRITIGARRLPLADFVGICLRQDTVQLDQAHISKIESDLAAAKPKPSGSPAKITVIEDVGESMPEMQSRAAVLQILVRLAQGKYQVRSSVMMSLADVLNDSDTRLSLPISNTAVAVSSLIEDLTALEYEAIKTSFSLPLAISACSSFAVMQMITWSDVVAAITLEGCAAQDSPLGAAHHEDARPHPGQLQSVSNIRTLLKGSQFIGKSGRTGPDPVSIRCVPQYHGPARDMIVNVARSLTIELNSAQPTIVDCVDGEFHAQPLSTALYLVLSAAAITANGSRGRLNDLIGNAVQLGLPSPNDNALSLLQEANSAAQQIQDLASVASSLISNVTDPDLGSVSKSLSSKITEVEQLLKRLLTIEIYSAMEAIQQRIDTAQSEFCTLEETRRSRMQAALGKVQAQLKDKPDDARLQKQAQGLTYQPREFSYSLGSGVSAVIARFKSRPAFDFLEPYSPQMAEFIDQLLMVTNEGKKPKRPKGTRDFGREDMMIRERVFEVIRRVFQAHGATGIDTPVFELKETLMGKYGEDSKLIYDLADQGGEQLSLRYDLTVPLARYLASNNISQIKRYHIARVYRRDNPAMNRGRFREFYQCDFDIAGHYDAMIPDAECLAVMCEILSALDLNFSVKFSHRVLLDAIMSVCDVPSEKFRTICSAIDKLDKETWATVREEMLQKGLDGASADKLEKFVEMRGQPFSVLESLRAMPSISAHKDAMATLSSLETLFKYLEACDVLKHISFDLSLARGLDYYTGAIYEAILTDTDQVGSIAAGGRYDELVGMFLPSNKQIPAVGLSIGIERIFTIIQERQRNQSGGIKPTYSQVLVGSVGGDLTVERFRILKSLWNAGISAELVQKRNPYFEKQLEHALDLKIPFIVLIGQSEVDNGTCNVKNTLNNTQETIPQVQLVSYLQEAIAALPSNSSIV